MNWNEITFSRMASLLCNVNQYEWDDLLGPCPKNQRAVVERCCEVYQEILKAVGEEAFEVLLYYNTPGAPQRMRQKRKKRSAGGWIIPAIVSAATTVIIGALTR